MARLPDHRYNLNLSLTLGLQWVHLCEEMEISSVWTKQKQSWSSLILLETKHNEQNFRTGDLPRWGRRDRPKTQSENFLKCNSTKPATSYLGNNLWVSLRCWSFLHHLRKGDQLQMPLVTPQGWREGWEMWAPASQILWATTPKHNPGVTPRWIMKKQDELPASNTDVQRTDDLKSRKRWRNATTVLKLLPQSRETRMKMSQPVYTYYKPPGAFSVVVPFSTIWSWMLLCVSL